MARLDLIVVFSVIATTAGYYTYYYLSGASVFRARFGGESADGSPTLSLFFATRSVGFLLMGLIPAILYVVLFDERLSNLGLTTGDNRRYWFILAILPLLAAIVGIFTSRRPSTFSRYPEVRLTKWSPASLILSASGWILYLFAYEFLFRGLLLFTLCYAYGPVIAVVLNVAIYSAFHLPKGAGETLGAIPLGLILCYCALLTSSFILPFLIHAALALSTHFFSIAANPEMKFSLGRKVVHP